MIKLIHTGDIHANKTRAENVVKFIEILIDFVKDNDIDGVLICGDFWDCAVVNNASFASIVAVMGKLINLVPVYMIYGTASHEISNSLDIFRELGANVASEPTLWTIKKDDEAINILGVPEPRRSNFISSSVEETDKMINKYLSDAFNIKSDLPLIVMHHNEVAGAKMQNGKAVSSNTKLTKSMYSKCNPLYIAMAHIHEPQTIDEKVRYCGSPIPCTFGELHRPSYTVLTYENKELTFRETMLPFAQNKVLECNSSMYKSLKEMSLRGMNVKIKLTLSPEQRKLFKIKEEAKAFKEATNAENVVISIITNRDISVRAQEITKTASLLEKLKIYAEVNELDLSSSVLEKAKRLEDNMLIKYVYPTHSFELISLSLRGAKGLIGRDEIYIDFTQYENGILALIGNNGSGKSTILENCSAYPRLLTRGGALRSHFYLKDSHRIVVYRDENNRYYRFTIQLAAHTENGLVKYFAETSEDNGTTWTKVNGIDGNIDVYTEYVQNLMGSVELYLRTAFFTKGKVKGVSDIASATKGERIALISELIGSDTLSDMHDMVKEELNKISKEMDKFENIEERAKQTRELFELKDENEKRLQLELSDVEKELKETVQLILKTKTEAEEYNKKYAKFGSAIQMKTECEDRLLELSTHLERLKQHKKHNDFFLANEKQIKEYKETYESAKPVSDELHELSKQIQDLSQDLLDINKEYESLNSKLKIEQNKYNLIDGRIANAEENLIKDFDKCPTCGAKLSDRKKKELLKDNEFYQDEIKSLQDFKATQKKIISETKTKLSKAKVKNEKLQKQEKELKDKFNELDESYKATNIYLELNKKYEEYMDYTPVTNLDTDIPKVTKELKATEDLLKSLCGVEFIDYKAKLEGLENTKQEMEDERLRISMDLASVKTQKQQLEETLKLMQEQEESIKQLSKEYEDYSILEKAFSNSGIQALELEAAAPSIADLTNQILHDSYGDKFSISFSTLKQSKNKVIDDFSIDVTNNESGWTTPIELLSEGEKVWVMQSLYYAFSIARMQRTGFNFAVRFVDESDGALDSEMRLKYLSMINAAHKAGQSRLTVMITHSQEIKDIVTQIIQL